MTYESSPLEDTLEFQIRAYHLPAPVRELVFARPRRWRFDFAWPDRRLAAEVEGGTWIRGRHQRPRGFAADAEKYNAATALGWRVLRFTSDMVEDGRAIDALRAVLRGGGTT